MKAQELIKHLQSVDPDMEVVIRFTNGNLYGDAWDEDSVIDDSNIKVRDVICRDERGESVYKTFFTVDITDSFR